MKNKKSTHKQRRPNFNKTDINSRIKEMQRKEVNEILSIYFVCEDMAVKIIKAANLSKVNKLNIDQLKKSMKNLGYVVKNSIDLIFHTNFNNKGLRSVRHFRNKVVHSTSKSAIKEIIRNRKIYYDSMMEFIDLCCNR